ncbi:MAG: hypothetical protein RQ757_11240 [Pseudomonadales bacterium]|nr:hypothetical protein [Pseudomonadales bacterium]
MTFSADSKANTVTTAWQKSILYLVVLLLQLGSGPDSGMAWAQDLESGETAAEDITTGEQTSETADDQPGPPVYIGRPQLLNEFGEVVPGTRLQGEESHTSEMRPALTLEELDEVKQLNAEAIQLQEERIQEIEQEGGTWAAGLSEELMRLGQLLRSSGNPEGAVEAYTRAAHISRVNFGLNSAEQVPVLEELVDTYVELEQWQEADRQQRHAFYIQTRAYDRTDPRIIPALESLAMWNVMTFNRGIVVAETHPLLPLLEAYRLYFAASQLVNVHFGLNDPRYINYLRNMAGTAFRLALYGSGGEIDRAVSSAGVGFAGTQATGRRATRVSGFDEGEEALRQIVDYYEQVAGDDDEAGMLRLANARLELADWHLLFNRRQNAFRIYEEVWQQLSAQDVDLAHEVFAQIVPLPAFTGDQAPGEELADSGVSSTLSELDQGYVDIQLNINQYGRPSGVRGVASKPENHQEAIDQVIRSTRDLLFRPQFKDGEEVSREQILVRVPYWY